VAEVWNEVSVASGILHGLSVLVVEDNGLLCCVLEEVGPFARLPEAMKAVPSLHVDIALLDINIRGQLVSPLAEHLIERDIPFILTSAYQSRDLPLALRSAVQLTKPFTGPDVLERLSEVITTHSRNI
jgi:CheY-like chemotaxis protein